MAERSTAQRGNALMLQTGSLASSAPSYSSKLRGESKKSTLHDRSRWMNGTIDRFNHFFNPTAKDSCQCRKLLPGRQRWPECWTDSIQIKRVCRKNSQRVCERGGWLFRTSHQPKSLDVLTFADPAIGSFDQENQIGTMGMLGHAVGRLLGEIDSLTGRT